MALLISKLYILLLPIDRHDEFGFDFGSTLALALALMVIDWPSHSRRLFIGHSRYVSL